MTLEEMQKAVRAAARKAADEVEVKVIPPGEGEPESYVIQFRYGRQCEDRFLLRGDTEKERLRDLGVRVEQFMGAR